MQSLAAHSQRTRSALAAHSQIGATIMQNNTANFRPTSGFKALLDQLYDIKFSKHTTLVVVLLSMVYTIYRTAHYLATEFALDPLVAWPTSTFIELLVLAAAAITFGSLRHAYIAELKGQDADRARVGVWLAYIALGGAFLALLFVAWSDAYRLTSQIVPTLIMTLAQFSQMLFIVGFISAADLDEREKLRKQFQGYQDEQVKAAEDEARRKANECPYCHKEVRLNNRKRHLASCPAKP
jgi:hypothetical protein